MTGATVSPDRPEALNLGLRWPSLGHDSRVTVGRGRSTKKSSVRQTIESLLGDNEQIIVQQISPTSRVEKVIEISFE